MLSLELADQARALAVWCQVRATGERDPVLQAEYRWWAEWLERAAGAVELELGFVRSLQGLDGRIPDADQELLEKFSDFTMRHYRLRGADLEHPHS